MSAFICSDLHISTLAAVHVGSVYTEATNTEKSRKEIINLATMLFRENAQSVACRYNEKLQPDESFTYDKRAELLSGELTPVEILKACHCYEYQSCEHPEWETSLARKTIHEIERWVTQRLPGYDEAVWGVRNLTEDEERRAAIEVP